MIRWLESKLKSRYDEVDSTYGKKFTYLGVLLEQQGDGSIYLSMPQYIEDITQSEFGEKEYSMPADQQNEEGELRRIIWNVWYYV